MAENTNETGAPFPLPRVTIKFCTQCKWMLRAAYFAQELLSTFSTSLGEVALQPSTGGTFVVEIFHQPPPSPGSPSSSSSPPSAVISRVLWDRKADGGFPETKELKRRVRDVIEPGRDLGHVDRHNNNNNNNSSSSSNVAPPSMAKPDGDVPAAPATAAAAASTSTGGQKERPSRAELEAAGQAGGGYPGSGEAAAQLVDDLQKGSKEVCEDCN